MFEIYNSTFNFDATLIARIIFCSNIKSATLRGSDVGAGLATATAVDSILEAAGQPKFCIPHLVRVYLHVFGEVPGDFEKILFKLVTPNTVVTEEAKGIVLHEVEQFQSLTPQGKTEYLDNIKAHVKLLEDAAKKNKNLK